jgi:hypothetical protein
VEYALGDRERIAEPLGASFDLPVGGLFRRLASLGRALMPQ